MSRHDAGARETLARLAEHLRRQKLPVPVEGRILPIKWAAKAADAIERYLSGEAKSLDAAFGLTPQRGRPTTKAGEHKAIARVAGELKLAGNSWTDVCDALSTRGATVTDVRTVRRIVDEYSNEFFVVTAEDKITRVLRAIDELITWNDIAPGA